MIGIAAAFLWTFPVSYVLFRLIASVVGIRVNGQLEVMGLDLHEHDNRAYPEFLPEDELLPKVNQFCYSQVKSAHGSGQFKKDLDVAFAVWNGSAMERSGRKSVSEWYHYPLGGGPQGPPYESILWTVAGLAIVGVALVTIAAVRNPGGGEE